MAMELSKSALDVGIVTNNADRMLGFYRDTLGFPAMDPITFPGTGTIHRLQVGDSILRIFDTENELPPAMGPNDSIYASGGIRYLTLLMSNLHEVVEACGAFGIDVSKPIREIRPGVFATTIQDPDGNWIELQSS